MLIFAVAFLLFANIVNHSKRINSDVKITFLLLVYIWLILIFSFPGKEVPDMQGYKESYDSNIMKANLEYLFSLIGSTAKSLGFSFNAFLFVYQCILFSIWFLVSRKIFTDVHFLFMVFLPFMGVYNFGITIRAGMGLCLCYYALTILLNERTIRNYIFYYIIVTLAVLFHESMIVFYVLPPYVFRKFNSIFLFTILVIAILVPAFNIQHLIAKYIESFINLFSANQFLSYTRIHAKFNLHGVYSLTMIKYFCLSLLFILLRGRMIEKEEIYNCFLNIYMTGVLLIGLTYFILAGNRLSYIFFFFEFALVGMLFEYSSIPKKLVLLGAIMLCLLNFANLVSAVPGMLKF